LIGRWFMFYLWWLSWKFELSRRLLRLSETIPTIVIILHMYEILKFCFNPCDFNWIPNYLNLVTSVNCSTNNPCPQNQECVYSGGNDYTGFCICPRGFVLTSDGLCRDINECDQQTFPCGPGAMCINTAGNFKCACPPRSSGDAYGEGCFGTNTIYLWFFQSTKLEFIT